MLALLSVGRQGSLGFHEGAILKFKPGISYVYGLNKTLLTKDKNSNAVGKSALLSVMSELLYDEPVVGLKADKLKAGKSFMSFKTPDGKHVKVTSSYVRKQQRLAILIDGVAQKSLTPTKAKAVLKRLFPITKDEFDSYCYIDARVPHPLVMGSPAERKRFFTSFFDLDKIDAERKLYAAELTQVLKQKAALDEVKIAFAKIKEDMLTRTDRIAKEELLATLQRKLKRVQAKAAEGRKIRHLLDFLEASKDKVEKLQKILGGELNRERFAECVKDVEWHLKNDTAGLADAEAWEDYKREFSAYEKGMAALGDYSLEDVKKASEAYERVRAKLSIAEEKLEDLPNFSRPAAVSKPSVEDSLEELRLREADIERHLNKSEKFEDGKCHYCGSTVKVKNPAGLRKELSGVQAAIKAVVSYEQYKQDRTEYLKTKLEKADLQASVDSLTNKVKSLARRHKLYAAVKDLEKPEPFKGKKLEVSVKRRMVEESRDKLQLLEFCRPYLDTIVEALQLPEGASAEVDEDSLVTLQNRIAKLTAQLELSRTVKTRALAMKARIEELEGVVSQEEALRILIRGYSDKGVKKMAIESISTRLIELVNHYAQGLSIFHGFTFEFIWNTTIQIVAHRPNGEASDVRKLSGAESLLFTLVLVLALASFVPSKRRLSALILDEPTASFGQSTVQSFYELLPTLNRLIPSIIILTPKNDEGTPDCHKYTVVKTAKGVTLERGHPEEL